MWASERMARRQKAVAGCPEERPRAGGRRRWEQAGRGWSARRPSRGRPNGPSPPCSAEPSARIPSSKLITFTSSCLKWPYEFIKIVHIHLVLEPLWATVSSQTKRPKCLGAEPASDAALRRLGRLQGHAIGARVAACTLMAHRSPSPDCGALLCEPLDGPLQWPPGTHARQAKGRSPPGVHLPRVSAPPPLCHDDNLKLIKIMPYKLCVFEFVRL